MSTQNQTAVATREDVNKPRADYNRIAGQWQRCRDVLAGEDAVKAAGALYLPRLGQQSEAEYQAYKARAGFFNGTERTRFALTGMVFRKDCTVVQPPSVESHLEDIDLDGTPLNDFAMGVLKAVIGVGRHGVLVDMPPAQPGSSTPVRPYWVTFEASQILNWRRAKKGGAYVTQLLVLREDVEEPDPKNPDNSVVVEQFRRFELCAMDTVAPYVEITIWRALKTQDGQPTNKFAQFGETILPQRRGKPLDFIPFVFINASSTQPDVEKPPLLDMVDVNLSHYRSSADLEHGEHFLGLPTPWVVGLPSTVNSIPLGPNNVIKLSGANAQAGLLEFKGDGLKQLEAALTRKQEMMAVLGARLIEQTATRGAAETATSVKSKNAATTATLSQVASTVSQALTQALRWHCWWFGLEVDEADAKVELNRDFYEPTLDAQDVVAEVQRWQAGGSAFETLYYVLTRGGRTRPGVSAEEELAAITAETEERANMAALVNPLTGKPGQPGQPAKPGAQPPKKKKAGEPDDDPAPAADPAA